MKRPMLAVPLLAALAAGVHVLPALAGGAALEVTDAWARPTIPTRPGAGYFTLTNTGDEPALLIGAEAERAEKVEIHTTEERNGVINMNRLESLKVSPGETVVFEPGGHHLMLMGLAEPLAVGEVFPAALIFEDAGEVAVEFTVGAEPPESEPSGGDGRSG